MHKNKNAYKHITDEAFYRLLMPAKLADLEFFLYLDTDIYVNFDLSETFKACPNHHLITVASNEEGFNSGVILINHKKFTEQVSREKTIELFNEHGFASDKSY
jgi:lipopolysaccharide biosynthesis glycosyltransferase